MKKTFIIVGLSALTTLPLQAYDWSSRWEWPLVAEFQSYNIGDPLPVDSSDGGASWELKNSKKPTDPQAQTSVPDLADPKPQPKDQAEK